MKFLFKYSLKVTISDRHLKRLRSISTKLAAVEAGSMCISLWYTRGQSFSKRPEAHRGLVGTTRTQ